MNNVDDSGTPKQLFCSVCRMPIDSEKNYYEVIVASGDGFAVYVYDRKQCRDKSLAKARRSDEMLILEDVQKTEYKTFMRVVLFPKTRHEIPLTNLENRV